MRLSAFSLALLISVSLSTAGWTDTLIQLDAQGEPTIQAVHKAALQYASLHPEIFKSMRRRSRVQAALPQLTVRMTTDLDKEERALTRFDDTRVDETNTTIPQNISATETTGNDLQLYAEARWKLNESIFNFQETAVMRENRYSAKERQKLLQTVTQVYFERKRALIKMRPSKPGSEAAALAQLKIAQIEAELDALTGGWFSKHIPPQNGG
jgi:hypothetical protein